MKGGFWLGISFSNNYQPNPVSTTKDPSRRMDHGIGKAVVRCEGTDAVRRGSEQRVHEGRWR